MNDNRKLNAKNKIYIILFSIIIIAIVVILAVFAKKTTPDNEEHKLISSNNVLYNSSFQYLDTSKNGEIKKNWNEEFQYINSDSEKFDLGYHTVLFDKSNQELTVLGDNYLVQSNGDIVKNENDYTQVKKDTSSFYKLTDRLYLIVSDEIYNEEKTIYAKTYLSIYLDTQGNASLINDSINVKTINPIILKFNKYTFDVANEKLIIDDTTIDLKKIIGSTNKYEEHEKTKTIDVVDTEKLVESYNDLISSFNQYTKNAGANQNISNNNYVINASGGQSQNNTGGAQYVLNATGLIKKASLRGAISSSTYIDVSYVVVDPENKYQTVYLLVTGEINGTTSTVKILLDKYENAYRINDLTPMSEYTISMGYIEVIRNKQTNEKQLNDQIEDVINLRTTKVSVDLSISKISSGGTLYYNLKMYNDYILSEADVSLYANNTLVKTEHVDIGEASTSKGFTGTFDLPEGSI